MDNFQLRIIGTGNAWPILVSEQHPFYDAESDSDLSNAAYLIAKTHKGKSSEYILIDAGFGVVPYLLKNENQLPEAVILTHAHLDHTVSLDWIVHSYFKKYEKKKKLPLYCSQLCYNNVISSFPQLGDKIDFKPITTGLPVCLDEMKEISITAYPVFHGSLARGARMIRIDISDEKKLLFTGDCLCPVLRKNDIEEIKNIPYFITDANNRYPYPDSNHWSILPETPPGFNGQNYLDHFRKTFGPSEVISTHLEPFADLSTLGYFDEWIREEGFKNPLLSIYDFCNVISPVATLLVHYGGEEDQKYYESKRLNKNELQAWVEKLTKVSTVFRVPLPGENYPII